MRISRVCAGPGISPAAVPGTVLSRGNCTIKIQVADGTVDVTAEALGVSELSSMSTPALAEIS
jgi:hypothetical protein